MSNWLFPHTHQRRALLSATAPLALFAAAVNLASPGARAQTAAPAAGQASSSGGIEEIVVTAQRREERLHDVPVAITAFSKTDLDERNVVNLTGLEGLAPNVKFSTGGSYVASIVINIRGGVSPDPAPDIEPTTGLYVDGVYIGKSNGALFELTDLDHIEILRGPQGTLYGRNALSGAVNVVTQKPTGQFDGDVKIGFGDYGEQTERVDLDLPSFGLLSAKISALYDGHDGYTRNYPSLTSGPAFLPPEPVINPTQDSADNKAARIALRLAATDDVTLDYAFDFSDVDDVPSYSQLTHIAAGGIFDGASPYYLGIPLYKYVRGSGYTDIGYANGSINNEPQHEDVRVRGHSLTAAWDLDNLTLKSISAYRQMDYSANLELDGTPYAMAAAVQDFKYAALSEELQAIGEIGSTIHYTAGLYYFRDGGQTLNPQQYFGNATTSDSRYNSHSHAYAAYGQVDYVPPILDDALTITGGLRYSMERKTLDSYLATVNSATDAILAVQIPHGTVAGDSFSSVTPTAIIKYDYSPDINVYAKYAQGFRAGGFTGDASTLQGATTPYQSETVDSYEIGTKTRFFDGRLQVNGDYFWEFHHNMQLLVISGINNGVANTSIQNAGNALVQGVEIEAQGNVLPWLHLGATVGTLDAHYESYYELGVDVKNDRAVPSTPALSFSLNADATLRQSDTYGDLHLVVDFNHQDRNYCSPTIDPYFVNDEQNVLNATLRLAGIEVPHGTLELAMWARNLTDDGYRTWSIDFGPSFGGLAIGNYGAPRTFGGTMSYKF
jgi:iron complex outermembrane receptor protein